MACPARIARLVCVLLSALSLLPAAVAAQSVKVVPGSVHHQNVQTALKFLREHGDSAAADEIQRRLDQGKIYVDPNTDGNGETTFATGAIYVDDTIAGNTRNEKSRETPFDYDRDFASVTSLARTLYHENEHSTHQGYWYDVFMRRSGSEHFAWTKTIRRLEDWIRFERDKYFDRFYQPARAGMTAADNRRELDRIATKIRNLTEYTNQYRTTHNYFGYSNDKTWVQGIDDYWNLELEKYVGPQLEKLQGSPPSASPSQPQSPSTPATPASPSAPEPEDLGEPVPTPCEPCQGIAAQIQALKGELTQLGQQAKTAKDAADQAQQNADNLQKKADGIERELNRAAGTGGSSYDPTSGVTVEAYDQGNGTVKVTTRDRNGNVTDEYVRDSSRRKAELAKQLEQTRAEITKAQAEAKSIADLAAQAAAAVEEAGRRLEDLVEQLEDCIKKYCGNLTTADALNQLQLPYESLDVLRDPTTYNAFDGNTNDVIQQMIIEIRVGNAPGMTVPRGSPAPSRGFLQDFRQPKTLLAALLSWLRPTPRAWATAYSRRSDEPRRPWSIEPDEQGRNRPATPGNPVQMLLTSLGQSTGQAFDLQIFNGTGNPLKLAAQSLVVEPLKDEVKKQVQSGMQRLLRTSSNPVTAKLNGYCLDFLKLPPTAGTLFKLASPELQKRFAPIRNIMDASRRVQQLGQLRPDSNPEGYFHAIRQWSMWTVQQKFNERTFADAFVEHTRKVVTGNKQPWSKDTEATIRKAAPNRWQDIQRILSAAQVVVPR